MSAIYPVAEIRKIEQAALRDLPPYTLMQRAGQAAAQAALRLLPCPPHSAAVLVLAGPGNNGGDALEAAAGLAKAGCEVLALLKTPPSQLPPDAAQALARAQRQGVHLMPPEQFADIDSAQWPLVIDGLFGIGLSRPLDGDWRSLVQAVNAMPCPVLALDVPSGLDADTGTVVGGTGGIAVTASHTITFIADKAGLYTGDGPDYAGSVELATLAIADQYLPAPNMWLNHPGLFSDYLRPRKRNSHKGSFGDVAVIGGAAGMAGAPILAARAAARCGAGRVFVGYAENPPAYDQAQPELMCRHAADLDFSSAVLVVGTGMGMANSALALLTRALDALSWLVLDADALNLLARQPQLQVQLAQRQHAVLMTPHPLEAARLLGLSTSEIQADRVTAARKLASRFNAVVVLKGAGSIIARADGAVVVNPTGNPALATAGSGDVLSGICGALLAQGWPQWEAALAAVWLHGRAADQLVAQGIGPIGLTAGELIPEVRLLLNQLVQEH
ncbi:bifunctional ADP-dependent NAD(P)H-hydrate dehydratase/NAD(P)H-hydrate epimerase [Collimonas pratensis]|uniref:Bifunctional NAD(P)H-hydrate repair enzyme n=1 Tax=Collimonas pratensis TaxID=279113 RepID=A0A127Q756_9BURK|nr:bifunctional ADP-dependent NAD(P)H-hydrate dehydratase/NAD(P)H-hydrate epimerase [Collimonas pratensis]AMP05472.1 yjeF-related family protein [Collimonas pratensis]